MARMSPVSLLHSLEIFLVPQQNHLLSWVLAQACRLNLFPGILREFCSSVKNYSDFISFSGVNY